MEKEMEEAIAMSLRSLLLSLNQEVQNDASNQPIFPFLFKMSDLVHTWADNPNCEHSLFNKGAPFSNPSRLILTYLWCLEKYNNQPIGSNRSMPSIMVYYIAQIRVIQQILQLIARLAQKQAVFAGNDFSTPASLLDSVFGLYHHSSSPNTISDHCSSPDHPLLAALALIG